MRLQYAFESSYGEVRFQSGSEPGSVHNTNKCGGRAVKLETRFDSKFDIETHVGGRMFDAENASGFDSCWRLGQSGVGLWMETKLDITRKLVRKVFESGLQFDFDSRWGLISDAGL